jgi:hypothetical protein
MTQSTFISIEVAKRVCVATAFCLLLSACAGGKIYSEQFHPNYQHSELMAFHGGREMRVEVLGIGDAGREAALAEAVGAAMTGHNPGLPIAFTPTPSDEMAGSPSRIAVLFDAPRGLLARSLCTREVSAPDDRETAVAGGTVLLAYCRRQIDLSGLRLDLPAGADPGSTAFADAFALATRQLLPLKSPEQKGEGRPNDFEM